MCRLAHFHLPCGYLRRLAGTYVGLHLGDAPLPESGVNYIAHTDHERRTNEQEMEVLTVGESLSQGE